MSIFQDKNPDLARNIGRIDNELQELRRMTLARTGGDHFVRVDGTNEMAVTGADGGLVIGHTDDGFVGQAALILKQADGTSSFADDFWFFSFRNTQDLQLIYFDDSATAFTTWMTMDFDTDEVVVHATDLEIRKSAGVDGNHGIIIWNDHASGFGRIEIGGKSGAYIDFKNLEADDNDARLRLYSNDVIALEGADLHLATNILRFGGNGVDDYIQHDDSGHIWKIFEDADEIFRITSVSNQVLVDTFDTGHGMFRNIEGGDFFSRQHTNGGFHYVSQIDDGGGTLRTRALFDGNGDMQWSSDEGTLRALFQNANNRWGFGDSTPDAWHDLFSASTSDLVSQWGSAATKSSSTFASFFIATSDEIARMERDGDWLNENGTYTTISDERLKTDIRPANSKLETVLAWEIVNYEDKDGRYRISVTGQQLQKVSPSLVFETEDWATYEAHYEEQTPVYIRDDEAQSWVPAFDRDGSMLTEPVVFYDEKTMEPHIMGTTRIPGEPRLGIKQSIMLFPLIKAFQEFVEETRDRLDQLERKG